MPLPPFRKLHHLRVCSFACLAVLPFLSVAEARAQPQPPSSVDATALVRRAVANHLAQEAAHHPVRFLLHKRDTRHDYIQKIIETQQGDVAMVIAANGAPLGPLARQAQMDRLSKLAANPALQEHRRRREQQDAARVDKLMRLLPDAFLYEYDRTVPCNVTAIPEIPLPGSGLTPAMATPAIPAQCYHLTFAPNPRFDPRDTESRILRGMAGDVLIETSHERLCRMNARLITDVDFGWGIIGHLDKGGTVLLEQAYIGPGNWQLTRMKLNLTGKALMVKSLAFHITEEMADFSQVPSHLDYHKAVEMLLSEAANPPQ